MLVVPFFTSPCPKLFVQFSSSTLLSRVGMASQLGGKDIFLESSRFLSVMIVLPAPLFGLIPQNGQTSLDRGSGLKLQVMQLRNTPTGIQVGKTIVQTITTKHKLVTGSWSSSTTLQFHHWCQLLQTKAKSSCRHTESTKKLFQTRTEVSHLSLPQAFQRTWWLKGRI